MINMAAERIRRTEGDPMINPYAVAAQARKAGALCALIPHAETQDGLDRTLSFVSNLRDVDWCVLARVAKIAPPSKEPAERGVSADVRRIVLDSLRNRQPLGARRSA